VFALSAIDAAFCALVVVAAFAIRGTAGFGGGIVAVPMLALVLPLQQVVPLMTALTFLASAGQGVRGRRNIQWREVVRLVVFALPGVALGLYLFSVLDPRPLSRALGIFVMLYAVYAFAMAGRRPALAERWVYPLAAVVGFAAGLAGTLFGGAAGPIFVIYLGARTLDKNQFRTTMTAIMVCMAIVRLTGYASLGFLDATGLKYLAAAIPLMMIGSYLGERLVRHVEQRRFERVLGGILIVSGAVLVLK
jgi:uncharacterized protein